MAYDPQYKEKQALKRILRDQWNRSPITSHIELRFLFVMPIPKSTSKKKTLQMVNGDLPHTKKPDLDNLVKNPMDCMNGIVYEDDRLVTKIFAEKCYGLEPRTEIRVIWCESDKETDSENGPQYGPKNTHNHLVE